jgi:hypothetical protein
VRESPPTCKQEDEERKKERNSNSPYILCPTRDGFCSDTLCSLLSVLSSKIVYLRSLSLSLSLSRISCSISLSSKEKHTELLGRRQ